MLSDVISVHVEITKKSEEYVMRTYMKKCFHPMIFVKCGSRKWRWVNRKAVRVCTTKTACPFREGGVYGSKAKGIENKYK